MHIIPEPHFYEDRPGEFLIKYNTEIILQEGMSDHCFFSAKLLQKEVKRILGFLLPIKKAVKKKEKNRICLFFTETKENREEYTIGISGEQIRIGAFTDSGFLYGITSLIQMIRIHKNKLPGIDIRDWPAFGTRGYMLDISRGRIPGMDYLKSLVDHLAFYKINQLQLYVESCVRLEGLEEIWSRTDAITPEEILELDYYCACREIELVPCLATFGHLYDMLRTESYSKYSEMEVEAAEPFTWYHRMRYHIVNVTDDEVFRLIEGLLEQYLPLFRSRKVNICCDETFDLGKGKSAAGSKERDYAKLYFSYVNKLAEHLQADGREVMLWADIILNHPGQMDLLNEKVVCLNWYYYYGEKEENIKLIADHNYRQYVCPSVSGYSRLVNAYDMSFANIKEMAGLGEKYKACGFLNTDWGDCGHINMPALSVPCMIYGAAMSWNPSDSRSNTEMDEAVSVVEYQDDSRSLVKVLRNLSRQDVVIFNEITFYRDYKMYGLKYPAGDTTLYDKASKAFLAATEGQLKEAIIKCEQIMNKLPYYQETTKVGEREMEEFLLAARGVLLFQTFVLLVKKYEYKQDVTPHISPQELAVDLEEWSVDYSVVWRKSSRESELFRITDFVGDICKLLRRFALPEKRPSDLL